MTSPLTRKDTPTPHPPHQTPGERQRKDLIFAFFKLFYPIGHLSFTFSLNSYSGVSSPTSSTITSRISRYYWLWLDLKVSKTWEVTWSLIPVSLWAGLTTFFQIHSTRGVPLWSLRGKKKKCLTCPHHLDTFSGGFWGFGRILPLQCIPDDNMK